MKKINEIFYSLQGEGFYTGTPSIFIRFAGCNLQCPFCDTDHRRATPMHDEVIMWYVCQYPVSHVVLTGGEPGLQIDRGLIDLLHDAGKYVCIETNGTCPLPEGIDWVTCSPKEGAPVRLDRIDELKLVYTGQDLRPYEALPASHYFLQPCSCANTEETVACVMQHPRWRLSLQTHKLIDIR